MHSFGRSVLDHPREVSITEATRRGVAGIISDAEAGDIVVTRHHRAVAAIVSIDRIEQIGVPSRVVTGDGARISVDDLLTAYGLSRAELAALPDDEVPSGADG